MPQPRISIHTIGGWVKRSKTQQILSNAWVSLPQPNLHQLRFRAYPSSIGSTRCVSLESLSIALLRDASRNLPVLRTADAAPAVANANATAALTLTNEVKGYASYPAGSKLQHDISPPFQIRSEELSAPPSNAAIKIHRHFQANSAE